MGKNRQAGPKTFVYTRVSNLRDFPLKKQSWGFFLKNDPGFLDQYLDF
jgi:hypothetical protein